MIHDFFYSTHKIMVASIFLFIILYKSSRIDRTYLTYKYAYEDPQIVINISSNFKRHPRCEKWKIISKLLEKDANFYSKNLIFYYIIEISTKKLFEPFLLGKNIFELLEESSWLKEIKHTTIQFTSLNILKLT